MVFSDDDARQFFRIHRSLMFFMNQRLSLIDAVISDPHDLASQPYAVRVKVNRALIDHPELVDAFVEENPVFLEQADLDIVATWKYGVGGSFFAFRQLKDAMIFLSDAEPVAAYAVVALSDTFDEIFGGNLPRLIKTILLPFKGRIVYDGLMTGHNITFGVGIKRRLNEDYKEIKERGGIVTLLSASESFPSRRAAVAGKRPKGGGSVAPSSAPAHDRIVALTDAFCRDRLDEEYAALCRKLAGVLARKRPSPITRGKTESWAAGIVRVVGWANFLGDPSQPHHMKMTDIDASLGVSEATGAAKSSAIRKLLKIDGLNSDWTLPSRMGRNPLNWMIKVNGLIVDARHVPIQVQEVAFRQGLIPYIPADGEAGPAEE